VASAHWPTISDIGQGLHASTVACAHRLGDIDRDLRALTRRRCPTLGGISQDLHASDLAYTHLANNVDQCHAASVKAYAHKPLRVRIVCASPTVAYAHRLTACDISQGLHASTVACAHLAKDIGQRHAASAKDWATSAVVYVHGPRTGDID